MIRLAANLSLLFTELPFLERFEASRREGFDAVEFASTPDMVLDEVLERLERSGQRQVLGTLPAPAGDKGIAAVPGAEAAFRQRFQAGLEAATRAGCPLIHVTSGVVADANLPQAREVFERNLDWAIPRAEQHRVKVVIEAINQTDVPGYFIRSLDDARRWIARLQTPSFGLLLDFYHAHMEGLPPQDLFGLVRDETLHVQIAGAPGRAEPDTGEVDYAAVLDAISRSGWPGWIGCEYRPSTTTTKGLAWRERLLGRSV